MTSILSKLIRLTPIGIGLMVSLLVLAYVGFGEGFRTYPTFVLDKLAAQGQSLKNSIDAYLQAGLPLNQFPGFRPLSNPMLQADPTILEVYVVDTKNEVVFFNEQQAGGNDVGQRTPEVLVSRVVSGLKQVGPTGGNFTISEDETKYWVELPLRNRFETVGQLKLSTLKQRISNEIFGRFLSVFFVLVGLSLLYFLFMFFTEHRWGNQEKTWLQISYGVAFFLMAAYVVFTLINLYSDGIQDRTKALAQSLSQRLNQVYALGIDISDISGLQKTFTDYIRLNPDISYVAMTSGQRIVIHTDPERVGSDWRKLPDHFEFTVPLVAKESGRIVPAEIRAAVNVGIPRNIVYSRLWRNIKNFSVLFIASAFISFFLLDVLLSVRRSRQGQDPHVEESRDMQVDLVRPVFFLGVFVEGIHVSFLPQYFQQITTASGLESSWTSSLFTLFFLAFALTLLPAGRYAESRGVKGMMMTGILLSSLSLAAMTVIQDYYAMAAVRILAGIGQGLIFIGCQSFIVLMASQARKTQGAAIIVFGYNGGFISGAAIGALLVNYIGPTGVFSVAAVLGVTILIYVFGLISEVPVGLLHRGEMREEGDPGRGLMTQIGKVLSDFQFMKTILLVGITTKAVLTGVTIFALPILMANAGYVQEDIGQILMFYSGGVLISSQFISRVADRTGRTSEILFFGTVGSGIGLMFIGLMGSEQLLAMGIPLLTTMILILGMALLGVSHGFINAPIITHIGGTPIAGSLGSASTISVYRFLERVGHVLGPVVVGQLLLFNQLQSMTIAWIGGASLVFAMLFILTPGIKPIAQAR